MQNCVKFSNIVLFLVCVSLILTSYEGFAKALQKPVVIRKKIAQQKEVRPISDQSISPKINSKITLPKPKSEISELPEKKEQNGYDGEEVMLAAAESYKPAKQAYDPARKIDPFEPLFREKANSVTPESIPIFDTDHKKGPLESIDTSQLKLTGIIYATGRNFALVQEASGKGHVIKKGTYIGTNGGKVIDILDKKVIIAEKWKDHNGKITIQKNELKLLKKSKT